MNRESLITQSKIDDLNNRLNEFEDRINNKKTHDRIIEIANVVIAGSTLLTAGISIHSILSDHSDNKEKDRDDTGKESDIKMPKKEHRVLKGSDINLKINCKTFSKTQVFKVDDKYWVDKQELLSLKGAKQIVNKKGFRWIIEFEFKEGGHSNIMLLKIITSIYQYG